MALAVVGVQAIGGDAGKQQSATRPAPPRAAASPPVIGPAPSELDALAGPPGPADLDVMTFNLRYADVGPNSWAQRRPVMRSLLRAERPDLIGTQEGLAAQLRDIDNDLGVGYDRIGVGREGRDLGEHMAIFFDNARLRPQKSGNFWLSETPQVPGSISWGSFRIRMVTWVLFTDLVTGRRFYAVNTHLDNISEIARRHGTRLIMDRLATFDPLPVVLTGDFNSPAEPAGPIYRLLTGPAGLRDTWTAAPRRGPEYATIHNYQPPVPGGERVDWILATPGVTAVAALMNTYRQGTQYPSDHLPVQARLRLP
ncbi:endonuclease/exonuclease/phosphatase family protein [Actinoplanes sp. NEAU-A11]|uniref:Endonuclease/exonuclease/phosphatase family protein n=2 Tax=Actinoplanes aureus TaxID=2792083 RepID=A0A931CCC3_9ACTN|nr:endonuclease/exonuclease/phosphatase family protein [Actinoplanes aureus]